MPKIVGANDPIRDVKWGNTQVTDVYKGSTLLWRGFHVTVGNCYNGNYNLPLVYGPGTTMTVPDEFTGGVPPQYTLDGFIMNGEHLYAGDTYTFEESPADMTITNDYAGSVPYSYKYKLQPNYVYTGAGDNQTTVIVKVAAFDVNQDGERVEMGGDVVKVGYEGQDYGYNLGDIYYQSGFTHAPAGLTIAGVTDLSGANFMTKWQRGISASSGQANAPSPLYSRTRDFSHIFGPYTSSAEVINYFYVYRYNGYYFV